MASSPVISERGIGCVTSGEEVELKLRAPDGAELKLRTTYDHASSRSMRGVANQMI